jgi:hypothetical protein
MLRRVALVRTDVSEKPSVSITRVTRIGELGTTLVVTSNRHTLGRNTLCVLRLLVTLTLLLTRRFLSPHDGGASFLRNIGSYKSLMA